MALQGPAAAVDVAVAEDAVIMRTLPGDPTTNTSGSVDCGRGLFAARNLAPRELLHEAPCIRVPRAEYDEYCRHTVFEEYLFNAPDGSRLLALGLGSLFNHSRRPNVDYRLGRLEDNVIRFFVGHRAVQAGEELCIYYGHDEHLWFHLPKEEGSSSDDGEDDDPEGDRFLASLGGAVGDPDDDDE